MSSITNITSIQSYTGASRARLGLAILCDMDDAAAASVLSRRGVSGGQKPIRRLTMRLDALRVR